jgi:hypothetical protein
LDPVVGENYSTHPLSLRQTIIPAHHLLIITNIPHLVLSFVHQILADETVFKEFIGVLSFKNKDDKLSQEALLSMRAEDWDNLDDADVEVVSRSNK